MREIDARKLQDIEARSLREVYHDTTFAKEQLQPLLQQRRR